MIEIFLKTDKPPRVACIDVTQDEKEAMLAELDFLRENLKATIKVIKKEEGER